MDNETIIKKKMPLAKEKTETKRWLFQAETIYKALRPLKIDDELLKYELELDSAIFQREKKQYDESEKILRDVKEALSRKMLSSSSESLGQNKYLPLLARCHHQFGEHYLNKLDNLDNELSSLKLKGEKRAVIKRENIHYLTDKSISHFNAALELQIKEGNQAAIVQTTLVIASIVKKERPNDLYNNKKPAPKEMMPKPTQTKILPFLNKKRVEEKPFTFKELSKKSHSFTTFVPASAWKRQLPQPKKLEKKHKL